MVRVKTQKITYRVIDLNGRQAVILHGMVSGPFRLQALIDDQPAKDQIIILSIEKNGGNGLFFKDADQRKHFKAFTSTTDVNGLSLAFCIAHSGMKRTSFETINIQMENRDTFGLMVGCLFNTAPCDIEEIIPASDGREPVLEELPAVTVEVEREDEIEALPDPPTQVAVALEDILGAPSEQPKALWGFDRELFDSTDPEDDLPSWARHHKDFNDPIFMQGAEATERRERAEERRDPEEPEAINYFSFLFLWLLLILVNIGEASVAFKTEHWDTLTSTEKEQVVETTYQWLKPRVENILYRPRTHVTAPEPPQAEVIAPPVIVVPPPVVKSTEVWRPLNYPSVPLVPFPGATIGPKPQGRVTEKKQ